MNEDTARHILDPLLSSYRRFNELAADVHADGSYLQAVEFKKVAGQVMGEIAAGFFMPLFHRFPELEPAEFQGPFSPPPALPEGKCLEIQAALQELAAQVVAIEALLQSQGTAAERARYLATLRDLSKTIALGERFITRALDHIRNPPAWWPRNAGAA